MKKYASTTTIIDEYYNIAVNLNQKVPINLFFEMIKSVNKNIDQVILYNRLHKVFVIINKFILVRTNVRQIIDYLWENKIHVIIVKIILDILCSSYDKISKKFVLLCIHNLNEKFFFNMNYIIENIKNYNDPEMVCRLLEKLVTFSCNIDKYVNVLELPNDIRILELVCLYDINGKYEIMYRIINKKIVPNQKCFKNLMKYGKEYITNKKNYDECNSFLNEMVQLLVEGGYELTEDDVCLASKSFIVLENCYNIEINDKIKSCYSKLMIELFGIKKCINLIKKIISVYDVHPNQQCLMKSTISNNKVGKKFISCFYPNVFSS